MSLTKLRNLFIIAIVLMGCTSQQESKPPNILFAIADDWGWPHAGSYGDAVVKTPTFDRLANEGILFENAFVSSPSCTPSRSAILTGQQFYRLGESANLWSTLDINIPVYPLLLKDAGYHIGSWRKSWAPGDLSAGGYDSIRPAGPKYDGFKDFLEKRPEGAPFSFWLGASDPHRGYKEGSGIESGIDISNITVPDFYPDDSVVRSDIADYYFEVQRFDSDVGRAIDILDSIGELDKTIIVMTGDHGMPFPRCKTNLYDMGVKVPLAIMWGKNIKANRKISDFVSLTDLAPTFLDLAGVNVPDVMTGSSLMPIMESEKDGRIVTDRDYMIFGRERHTPAQLAPSIEGYPARGIRTGEFLYIKNLHPDRWPVGVPIGASHPFNIYADCDGGPTRQFILDHSEDPEYAQFMQWNFGKRPAEELYDIASDPFQLKNLADIDKYTEIKSQLEGQLIEYLENTGDPRFTDQEVLFDSYHYRSRYELNKTPVLIEN